MDDRGLTNALDELLRIYDGSYANGIDLAIAESCSDADGIRIRELVREEDARYTQSWPEMLGRQAWEIESSHGRAAVQLRLKRIRKRLKNDEARKTKAARTADPVAGPGG